MRATGPIDREPRCKPLLVGPPSAHLLRRYKKALCSCGGRTGARQVSIAELFGLSLDIAGGLSIHVTDTQSSEIEGELLQEIDPGELCFDLLRQCRFVDGPRLVGFNFLLLDMRGCFLTLGREFGRNVARSEFLAGNVTVQQPQRMLAGKLAAGTAATIDGRVLGREVCRA